MLMCKITCNAILILLFCSFSANAQETEQFEYKPRPLEFEKFYDTGNGIIPLKMPVENTSGKTFESKLPYPILFIHGLNSNSQTWTTTTNYFDSQYSFTYGGRFDFCLNADGNNATTNKNFYPSPGADIAAFEAAVVAGDYYLVNFDVKVDGSYGTNVLSNQSAIAKQGAAVKKAIERVLQLTGKDKVILVGHSMGGLASREYLQNSSNWQTDGAHHVAKLLTVGTPHGGSNASDIGLGWFAGIDTRSEAIRDLKETYYYSGDIGRFLFGGVEISNNNNMNEHSSDPDFYNIDVNCNGVIGDNIVGLNQKPIDNLIDFSSVIGRITNWAGTNITSDGVVDEPQSRMNYYYPGLLYPTKIFLFNSGYDTLENHTELPGYYYQIMQGLDEPNLKELAYGIETNKNYIGYTTVQESPGADNDYYKFSVTENVSAAVSISTIATSAMNATILNSSGSAVSTTQNNSGTNLNFTVGLTPGNYFLKITSASPTATNYQAPYNFIITSTLNTLNSEINELKFYPNPVKDILKLQNVPISNAVVYSALGQMLDTFEFDSSNTTQTIDLSAYPKGIYLITLENGKEQQTITVAKE